MQIYLLILLEAKIKLAQLKEEIKFKEETL